MIGDGWTARVETAWERPDELRVAVYRRRGDDIEVAIPVGSDEWLVRRIDDGVAREASEAEFRIPLGIAEALRDGLNKHIPIPPDGRLEELRETLAIERRRIDQVLDRLVVA